VYVPDADERLAFRVSLVMVLTVSKPLPRVNGLIGTMPTVATQRALSPPIRKRYTGQI
jgi:hypothetical protein